MRRFNFRLEKVLKLRQYNEQEAKSELGRAIGILNVIENNIKQNAFMRNQAAKERFAGIGADGINGVHVMLAWNSYINRLEQEAERLLAQAAQAQLVVEEKQHLYVEASRELKVMEKLKEKKEKEYHKEVSVAETRELDEIRHRLN